MPLYEYKCQDCHKMFSEVLTVKEHDSKKIRCPKCKGDRVEKVIEQVSVLTGRKSQSW